MEKSYCDYKARSIYKKHCDLPQWTLISGIQWDSVAARELKVIENSNLLDMYEKNIQLRVLYWIIGAFDLKAKT